MKYNINPFVGVGNLTFGLKRDTINNVILNTINYKPFENKNVRTGELSTSDYFESGLISSYYNSSYSLICLTLTDLCEPIFGGLDLLEMNYPECLEFMKKYDNNIEEEEYVD